MNSIINAMKKININAISIPSIVPALRFEKHPNEFTYLFTLFVILKEFNKNREPVKQIIYSEKTLHSRIYTGYLNSVTDMKELAEFMGKYNIYSCSGFIV